MSFECVDFFEYHGELVLIHSGTLNLGASA